MTGLMSRFFVAQLLQEQLKGRSIAFLRSCHSRYKRITVGINEFWAHISATCCLGYIES